jgi:hypothetical protein
MANPADAKVCFLISVLHADHVARFVKAIKIAKPSAMAGDIYGMRGLNEGLAVLIHTPYPDGKTSF